MLTTIINDIITYWKACWGYALIFGVCFLICRLLLFRRQRTFISLLSFFGLGVYTAYFLYVVFGMSYRNVAFVHRVHFELIQLDPNEMHYVIENFLFFIPFGILLPICFHGIRSWRKLLVTAFGTSVCVEVLQYVFACGETELNDVLMNVLGAMVGYFILRGIYRCRER